jgi:carbon-monoxide dehydrogenase medium subunit
LKPPPFEYVAPTTLADAVRLLAEKDNARLLAGGQSLMAMLNMRYVFPDRIVDLNGVTELDFIREEKDEIVIGAMTRQRTLQRAPQIGARAPIIPKALRYVGHLQTRNRGTLGGSLCQLDPAAELPAVAAAYDAVVEAIGPNGRRSIPFAEFPSMFMTSSLAPDEILTAMRFKPWTGSVGTGFREFARRHGDFAIAGAIALLSADAGRTIERASLTLFGVAEAPVRAGEAEAMLIGRRMDDELFTQASSLCASLATLDDAYGSADYRGHVAAAMAERALRDAAAEIRWH